MSNVFNETKLRSLIKTVSWRIILTLSHIINGFIVTGNLLMGFKIAGMALIINSVLYWIHERFWNYIHWQRQNHLLYKFKEKFFRTGSKVLSWRIIVTITNMLIPFILTGDWKIAAFYTGLATIVNMSLYWIHEYSWNFIVWGKQVKQQIKV